MVLSEELYERVKRAAARDVSSVSKWSLQRIVEGLEKLDPTPENVEDETQTPAGGPKLGRREFTRFHLWTEADILDKVRIAAKDRGETIGAWITRACRSALERRNRN